MCLVIKINGFKKYFLKHIHINVGNHFHICGLIEISNSNTSVNIIIIFYLNINWCYFGVLGIAICKNSCRIITWFTVCYLPVMILFKSDMGHGVDFMAGTCEWHGKAPSQEQCEKALAQLEETLVDF